MFFIIGIKSEHKPVTYAKTVICNRCEKYGRYEVMMAYTCLTLFFIPIIKWNRKFYVQMSCCRALYELEYETGKKIQKGQEVEIRPEELKLVRAGNADTSQRSYNYKKCINCGYETTEDFDFCPKCGKKL